MKAKTLSSRQRKTLELLSKQGFVFNESSTRLAYGHIGYLTAKTSEGDARIDLYQKSFYVKNGNYLALTKDKLKVIARVQRDFKNLTS